MISDRMAKELNEQFNKELFASHLYFAMSTYFESRGLKGMASWMRKQAQEEFGHAMKFYTYLFDQDQRATVNALKEPQNDFESALGAFEAALKHEQYVTGCINKLVDLALEEKDHATNVFLNFFVEEQVEEESTARDIIDRVKMVKEIPHGLLLLDRELGARQ